MTAKDFRALAFELAKVKAEACAWDAATWSRCVSAVADACRHANPRFDEKRFKEACEQGMLDDVTVEAEYYTEPYSFGAK